MPRTLKKSREQKVKKNKNRYPGKLTDKHSRATIENIPIYCAYDKIINTSELKTHPRNPNEHPDKQIILLAHIIRTQGWRAPITISNQSGYIVRGHGRLAAANKLNLKSVPVEYQDYENERAEWADLIADNKIAELATMNPKKTAGIIETLNAANYDLTLTGITTDDLVDILNNEKKIKEEKIILTKIKTTPGDLYQLGEHRLLCGDATNKADTTRLMGTDRAQLIFTDPPYGVNYNSDKHGRVTNDTLKDNTLINLLLTPAFKNMTNAAKDNAAFFIWYANLTATEFEYSMKSAGLQKKQILVWIKQNFVLGRADYHYNYEPCFYAQKTGHQAKYTGDRSQTTTWELTPGPGGDGGAVAIADGLRVSAGTSNSEIFIKADGAKGKKLRVFRIEKGETISLFTSDAQTDTWRINYDAPKDIIHATQKPIELASRPIKNHTDPGDIVDDFFAGSGGLLIAADRLERRARLIELEPRFCDAIINRYINYLYKQNKSVNIKLIKKDGTEKTIDIKGLSTGAPPEVGDKQPPPTDPRDADGPQKAPARKKTNKKNKRKI